MPSETWNYEYFCPVTGKYFAISSSEEDMRPVQFYRSRKTVVPMRWVEDNYPTAFFCPYIGAYVVEAGEPLHIEGRRVSSYAFDVTGGGMLDRIQPPGYHSQARGHFVAPHVEVGDYVFGVEVETFEHFRATEFLLRHPDVIGERDGSLNYDYGIEWILPPRAYSVYADTPMCKWLLTGTEGYSYENNYGMHINVGRNNLDDAVQRAAIRFVNVNQFLTYAVSGRVSEQWAKCKPTLKRVNLYTQGMKHVAVNLKNSVLEFRTFKATRNEYEFRMRMQYVKSILDFCRDCPRSSGRLLNYMNWLGARQQQYPQLSDFLHKRGTF